MKKQPLNERRICRRRTEGECADEEECAEEEEFVEEEGEETKLENEARIIGPTAGVREWRCLRDKVLSGLERTWRSRS